MHWGELGAFQWFWVAIGLLVVYLVGERLKERQLRNFADSDILPRMTSSLSRNRRNFRFLLLFLAVVLLVISLAKPEAPGKMVMVKREGIDIVISVDVSESMLAEDIRPSRLDKAKLELQELVSVTRGDRIGVVAFAGDAYIQVPLTVDKSAVKLFLKSLSPNMIPVPGTNLSRAIQAGLVLFDKEAKGDKVIILLTDGEDHESNPLVMARRARKEGVRIYTIGIGTPEGDVIPVRRPDRSVGFKKDLFGNTVVSKLDEDALIRIAETTGGSYFRSRRGLLEVDNIYQAIQGLETKETGSGWVVEYDPLYQLPLLLALACLILNLIASERRKERVS